jgi:hypothetical protein
MDIVYFPIYVNRERNRIGTIPSPIYFVGKVLHQCVNLEIGGRPVHANDDLTGPILSCGWMKTSYRVEVQHFYYMLGQKHPICCKRRRDQRSHKIILPITILNFESLIDWIGFCPEQLEKYHGILSYFSPFMPCKDLLDFFLCHVIAGIYGTKDI